jgi:hypothetical protein
MLNFLVWTNRVSNIEGQNDWNAGALACLNAIALQLGTTRVYNDSALNIA